MLIPPGSPGATLVVRRGNGQFALERIDARVASAVRAAAGWRSAEGPEQDCGAAERSVELV